MQCWHYFIAGLLVGNVVTMYLTVKGFRDRINASVLGFIFGSKHKPKKQASPRLKQYASKPKTTPNSKMAQCLKCKGLSPEADMIEVAFDGSGRPLGFIHPECQGDLAENKKTFDYQRRK